MRQAPSRIEYSEWTCRWTKSTARPLYKGVPTGPFGPAGRAGLGSVVAVAVHAGVHENAEMKARVPSADDGPGDGRAVFLEEGVRAVRVASEEAVQRGAVLRPRAGLAGERVRRRGSDRERRRRRRAADRRGAERLRRCRRPRGRERPRESGARDRRRRGAEARPGAGELRARERVAVALPVVVVVVHIGHQGQARESAAVTTVTAVVVAVMAAPRERTRRQRQSSAGDERYEDLSHSGTSVSLAGWRRRSGTKGVPGSAAGMRKFLVKWLGMGAKARHRRCRKS